MNDNKLDRKNSSDLPFRQGVGMMIVDKHKRVFVGKRVDSRATLDVPGLQGWRAWRWVLPDEPAVPDEPAACSPCRSPGHRPSTAASVPGRSLLPGDAAIES